jgi:trehalose-phosphatase
MTGALADALERLIVRYRAGDDLLLLFDYDGTLVPFVPHPSLATCPEPPRRSLQVLASHPRVVVGVVSSRGLVDLMRLVDLPDLFYAGSSGLEVEFRGRQWSPEGGESYGQALAGFAEALSPELPSFPGAWIERKPWGLAVHYRDLHVPRRDRLRETAHKLVERFPTLRFVDAAQALEITPGIGWSKGTAIDLALEQAARMPCAALYAGDEANDAEAISTMNSRGGVTIGVGLKAPSAAQYRLPDPQALWAAMAHLGSRLESPPGERGA